jgi:putative Mg2+ transporter-C (MgtC) family protein
MSTTLSWSDIMLRLALSVVVGVLIGLDRGEHAHPVGLRTTVLVAVAATIAMLQANWLVVHMEDTKVSIVRLDAMRLPLGILSGIGFIGAGAILRREEMVRGVTTAATIWLVTVIGLCFGGGQLGLGVAGTVIALATLWLLKYAEAALVRGRRGTIAVSVSAAGPQEASLFTLLASRGFVTRSRRVELTPDAEARFICNGRYKGAYPDWSAELVRDLAGRPGIIRVEWWDTD